MADRQTNIAANTLTASQTILDGKQSQRKTEEQTDREAHENQLSDDWRHTERGGGGDIPTPCEVDRPAQ